MKIHRFEDVIAWQRAQDLAVNVYTQFKDNKDWDFKSQICRAAVSISNNIEKGLTEVLMPNSEDSYIFPLHHAVKQNPCYI